MKRGRLPSFTLTEVMVVLALNGMVVAIAFYVWYNFESFGAGYRDETKRVNEWNALDFALRQDASASVSLQQEGSALRFWQADSVPGPRWESLPRSLVRLAGTQVDTFHIPGISIHHSCRQSICSFQLIPSDSLLPDTITYPLPAIAGARRQE